MAINAIATGEESGPSPSTPSPGTGVAPGPQAVRQTLLVSAGSEEGAAGKRCSRRARRLSREAPAAPPRQVEEGVFWPGVKGFTKGRPSARPGAVCRRRLRDLRRMQLPLPRPLHYPGRGNRQGPDRPRLLQVALHPLSLLACSKGAIKTVREETKSGPLDPPSKIIKNPVGP